jgi:predicted naringenin-chalcone synthase
MKTPIDIIISTNKPTIKLILIIKYFFDFDGKDGKETDDVELFVNEEGSKEVVQIYSDSLLMSSKSTSLSPLSLYLELTTPLEPKNNYYK